MLRIFLAVALLASESSGYSSESSSETSSPTPSESSTCEDTPSEPSPHPCPPVAVGQCCDYCPFCKDENAICATYGLAQMCICKTYYTFDYDWNECVPDDPNNNRGSDDETQDQMMKVARNGAPMLGLPYTPPWVLYHGWSYRYYDEIAQSYCASKLSVGYAFA
ncbi:uncharacterized protein LOC128219559 [Mya arenaria]|uniref:uncharacterized protein LOC128219559 n=1 Tax=Mya arenaria TaxID=6604 RepID=UPI0022E8BA8E|nr:uncharacterized protein LOC128219559 [Mya arenaria]